MRNKGAWAWFILFVLCAFFAIRGIVREKKIKHRLENVISSRDSFEQLNIELTTELSVMSANLTTLTYQYENEKAQLRMQIETLQTDSAAYSIRTDSLERELKKAQSFLRAKYISGYSEGFVEEKLALIKELEQQIKDEQQKTQSATATIAMLELEMSNNDRHVAEMTAAIFKVYDMFNMIESELDKDMYLGGNPELLSFKLENTGDDVSLVEKLDDQINKTTAAIKSARGNLRVIEQNTKNYERQLEVNKELLAQVKKLTANLDAQERKMNEFESILNTRYLLKGTRDELIQLGILKKERSGFWIKDRYKYQFDLAKINKKDCQKISKNDLSIYVNDISQIRSPHPTFSYSIENSSNLIRVHDKEEFWKATMFLVIETE